MTAKFTIVYQHLNSGVKKTYVTDSEVEAIAQLTKLSKEYELVDLFYRNF